jgi:succinyl-CoA synthetase beta subunit
MKLHEYQSKQLFAQYGIPIPRGKVAATAAEAREVATGLGCPVVIKAQVLVGGRGKAGGIRLARTPEEAEAVAAAVLRMTIKGLPVNRVLVDEAANIRDELYLGMTIDRAARRLAMIASSAGGVDIEEVARTTPEKIVKVHIDPFLGLRDYQARDLAWGIGLAREHWGDFTRIARALYEVFMDSDASLAEINPLALVTNDEGRMTEGEGRSSSPLGPPSSALRLLALDGKIVLDDNALFRHPDLAELRDLSDEAPAETEARLHDLSYVKLSGEIGCMVNGAGLAMATMDTVKMFGAEPANFLDIGGGATAERVAVAFRLILSDPNVKAILINIFGGITRCDEVARGILEGMREVKTNVPMIARLVGTNEEEGRALLQQANFITARTLMEAARKAVEAAREYSG